MTPLLFLACATDHNATDGTPKSEAPSAASLMVTEVMATPFKGDKWVEIYNPTDQLVAMADTQLVVFSDTGTNIIPLADLQLPAGAYHSVPVPGITSLFGVAMASGMQGVLRSTAAK